MRLGHIAKKDYFVNLHPGSAVNIRLGTGIDMSDDLFPILRLPVFGKDKPELESELKDIYDDSIKLTSIVYESKEEKDEASRIAASFSGHYGIASGSAAYSKAKEELSAKSVFYIELSTMGLGSAINPNHIKWKVPPKAETLKNENEILDQFLQDYGSHYITRIYYGIKIIIRATIQTNQQSEKESFSASLKAAAASWGAGGNISVEHEQRFKSSNVETLCSIICGDVSDIPIFISGIDDVKSFLNKFNNKEISIPYGPIACDVVSYWHTLIEFPKIRKLLTFSQPKPLSSNFGIHKGTINAWHPPIESIILDENGIPISLVIPEGWAICDGNNNTPNLIGHFIRGVYAINDLGMTGGADSHSHNAGGTTSEEVSGHWDGAEGADNGTGRNWNHRHSFSLTTENNSNLPPYVGLLYIIKI